MLGSVPTADRTEVWRPIPGWEDSYQVSNHGRVRSLDRRVPGQPGVTRRRRGKVLKQNQISSGYLQVVLRAEGCIKPSLVHRLVCETFHGPAPSPRHEVAHFDGTKNNNVPENLRWATRSENQMDRRRHGTDCRNGKIDGSTAVQIIKRLNSGARQKDIAAELGVPTHSVQAIALRRTWNRLGFLLER